MKFERLNSEPLPLNTMLVDDVEVEYFTYAGKDYFMTEVIRLRNNPWITNFKEELPCYIHGIISDGLYGLFVELTFDEDTLEDQINLYKAVEE